MWFSFAPQHPEHAEQVRAKRGSVAPAQSADLPRRESPTTARRLLSASGSVSSQSATRLAPHAQALIAPQLVSVRSEGFCRIG